MVISTWGIVKAHIREDRIAAQLPARRAPRARATSLALRNKRQETPQPAGEA
jgi:hypothetical protein